MKKIVFFLLVNFLIPVTLFAQQESKDSILAKPLNEVIVIGKKVKLYQKQSKPLATIDEYLQQSSKVDMIKRGGYAWEPIINSMATERTLITIDGMRIFGACTDKMDPITSYVEVSNLAEATVVSGQQGGCHGATIGGAIDLKKNESSFSNAGWSADLNAGYESNSNQKIIGSAVNYVKESFYVDTDFMLRKADNYFAGNNEEIHFSQFQKFNISASTGFRLDTDKMIKAAVIYDKATDVGYPALPMDVSLAKALITSLSYEYVPAGATLQSWETKLYYNTITHIMDDTKRPNVPIHMDMPGWSDTYGMYSKAKGIFGSHHFTADVSSFYNRSIAEMTMYPNDPNENLMFMYTWPDVRTLYYGLFLEDNLVLNTNSNLLLIASIASHSNKVASQFGLESLQIFYPNMDAVNTRFLGSFSTKYNYTQNGFEYGLGLGYGERAPSVSEGYGFYLFNSFDGYDYIGNPDLDNEQSLESSVSFGYSKSKWSSKLSATFFHISNYIVGAPDASLIPMTIGANGVKVYTALDYATLFNMDLNLDYQILESLKWQGQLVYAYGKESNNRNLPFISPLSYFSAFNYLKNRISASIAVVGNATQSKFSSYYGENETPDYAVLNASVGYSFYVEKSKWNVRAGIENVFDTYYSTFSSWNNIPNKGRNFVLNLNFGF
jgi:iron complex outermembrane receptor protein